MSLLPNHLGALLPPHGDPAVGARLVALACRDGLRVTPKIVAGGEWIALPVRTPTDGSVPYERRLDPSVSWRWRDGEAGELAAMEVHKVSHLFHAITRVTTVIPTPGTAVRLHYDVAPGNIYREGTNGAWADRVVITPHRHHNANRFLSIKLMITEKQEDYGETVIRWDGRDWLYSTRNRFFALNEVEMLHGARAVGHLRGVLWIDGWINLDTYDREARDLIPLTPLTEPFVVAEGYERLPCAEVTSGILTA